MEIKNLSTLSQFVKHINVKFGEYVISKSWGLFSLVERYDKRLDEVLLKGYFINPLEKPDKSLRVNGGFTDNELYNAQNERWENAETKVIFKSYINSDFRRGNRITIDQEDCYYDIEFRINGDIWVLNDDTVNVVKTLRDLSEATSGQLKLKNVTL